MPKSVQQHKAIRLVPPRVSAGTVSPQQSERDLFLSDYVAEIRTHLAELSETEAQAVLNEVGHHLITSVQAREELGETSEAAWQNALIAFGSPESVGRALTTTYQTTGSCRKTLTWASVRQAVSVLVPLNLIVNGLLLATSWVALSKRHDSFWNSAVIVVFVVSAFMFPVFAGARIGASSISRRPGVETLLALALLIAATLPVQLLFSLTSDGGIGGPSCLFLGFTALYVYWLLTAPGTAYLTGRITHDHQHNLLLTR